MRVIKIGPIHSVFEAPFVINVKGGGKKITDVEINIGFGHRGIEGLALQRSFDKVLHLIERTCGLCSHTHSLCYCQAVEKIAEIKVPERALFIRTIISELERLHSHLFWMDTVSETLEFHLFGEHILEIREGVMKVLEAMTGNRVMFSINKIGGVRRDIENEKQILRLLDELEKPINKLYETFDCNTEILEKTKEKGILIYEKARDLGVVGPTAEASGVTTDIRKDAPYAAYSQLEFKQFTCEEGDAYSRIIIHFWEIFESINVIKQAFEKIPTGIISASNSDNLVIPIGEAISRVEAPRGELFYYVASDGSEIPKRVRIRVPTYANLPAVKWMLKDENIENLSLVLASIDPCFACTER